MTRARLVPLVLLLAAALTACAAGPNNVAHVDAPQELAGFWQGLWHGLITPVTFIVSLFDDDVNIYEVHNDGNWYNFGFMLGVSTIFSALARPAVSAGKS
ncbi:hypothetical protein ABGB12_01645 [Actinocorallia sp. B10E7]|uniref:hypothetical protein n=1 Tax=Actinocorallia sp. B10E7 TaxID=3153558 RepID=UPI00325E4CC0